MTQALSRIITPADLKDQRWLDQKIEQIEMGVEAVIDIARNWDEGRNLARLHPGVSAAEYVSSRVGALGKAVVPVLLEQSNWSYRQIATIAGLDESTVRYHAAKQVREFPAPVPRGPVLGADGKTYAPRVASEMRAAVRAHIRGLAAESEAELQAATAGWSPELREAMSPELVRQRGEVMRLVRDIARLPEPAAYAELHGPYLSPDVTTDAALARDWLETFLEHLDGRPVL